VVFGEDPSACDVVLKANGISDRFPGVVAHGIHSLTVEDLRMHFNPSVGIINNVPVVNPDLSSNQPILHDAPEAEASPFRTEAMRVIDRVLSHADNKDFDVRGYNALERVTHAMHMREVWTEAGEKYSLLVRSPVPKEVCACAMDIEQNGVMDILRFIALKIREPALVYGKHVIVKEKVYNWEGNVYSYGFGATSPSAILNGQETTIPPLQNQTSWEFWKNFMIKNMVPTDPRELAVFVYCALHV